MGNVISLVKFFDLHPSLRQDKTPIEMLTVSEMGLHMLPLGYKSRLAARHSWEELLYGLGLQGQGFQFCPCCALYQAGSHPLVAQLLGQSRTECQPGSEEALWLACRPANDVVVISQWLFPTGKLNLNTLFFQFLLTDQWWTQSRTWQILHRAGQSTWCWISSKPHSAASQACHECADPNTPSDYQEDRVWDVKLCLPSQTPLNTFSIRKLIKMSRIKEYTKDYKYPLCCIWFGPGVFPSFSLATW